MPVDIAMNAGDKFILNMSSMEKDTWYGFSINGGDVTKIPVFRMDHSLKNSNDALVFKGLTLVHQVKTATIGGVARAFIFFKLLETYKDTGMSYSTTSANITIELISPDDATIPFY